MKKIKFGIRLIGVLIVLAFLWGTLFLVQFIFAEPNNENRNFIPTSAHTVMCIDGHLALKTVLRDLISNDEQTLLDRLNTRQTDPKRANLGIDFNSEIFVFLIEKDATLYQGALFNLSDEDAFLSSFEKMKSTYIGINGSVGLILVNTQKDISLKTLNTLGESLLNKENKLYESNLRQKTSSNALVTLWSRKKKSKLDSWNALHVSLGTSTALMTGNFIFTGVSYKENSHQLTIDPSSFHVTLNDFSSAIYDRLPEFNKAAKLTGISMNYNSLKIVQDPSFSLVPNADFLLNFFSETTIQDVLNELNVDSVIIDRQNATFDYFETTFHYKELTSTSIFIGRNPYSAKTTTLTNHALILKGSPSVFTRIEGNDFLMRVLEIFPVYKAGKGLANSIEDINIKVTSKSEDSYSIDGQIQFKDNRVASIELLLFLLQGED